MTDREMILEILKKANITILVNQPCYLEIKNDRLNGDYISFDFGKSGELLSIWA